VDVRIGVSQHPRELDVELADDTDREALKQQIADALADDDKVLWLTDRRGRDIVVPAAKIAYVEIDTGDAERRIGFGA
jgi:ABC-type branched-subunit amino acid transport system substrate-binding protein